MTRTMKEVAVDYEIDQTSAVPPDMTTREMTALRESIEQLGQLVPIVLWQGKVIDGRKRLAVCQQIGHEPLTVTIPERANATAHATALNLLRTQYSVSQRAMYASRLSTLIQGQRPPRASSTNSSMKAASPPTAKEAAELVGVHESAVIAAKRVRRSADTAVVEAVERGDLTIYEAEKITKGAPKAEQAAIATKVIAAKRGKRNAATARVLGQSTPRGPRQRPVAEVLTRLFRGLEDSILVLEGYRDAPLPDEALCTQWGSNIDHVLTELRRFRRRLQNGGGAA